MMHVSESERECNESKRQNPKTQKPIITPASTAAGDGNMVLAAHRGSPAGWLGAGAGLGRRRAPALQSA